MATKVIGPIVKPDPNECPTGWCDEQNGQFAAPKNWGAQGEKRNSPKLGGSK